MKSSQSNFNLRSPSSYLARCYLIATVKTQNSINNLLLYLGLTEENMDLSHFHLAVTMFMKKIFLNLPSVLAILPASQEFWSQSSTWIQLRQNIRRASCAAVRTKMVSISPMWFTQKLNLK